MLRGEHTQLFWVHVRPVDEREKYYDSVTDQLLQLTTIPIDTCRNVLLKKNAILDLLIEHGPKQYNDDIKVNINSIRYWFEGVIILPIKLAWLNSQLSSSTKAARDDDNFKMLENEISASLIIQTSVLAYKYSINLAPSDTLTCSLISHPIDLWHFIRFDSMAFQWCSWARAWFLWSVLNFIERRLYRVPEVAIEDDNVMQRQWHV